MNTKLFITWLLCTCFISTLAQTSELEYFPFAQEGKKWKTQIGGFKENVFCYQIDGDTILNGETWKKVYSYIGWPELDHNYFAAIRDVGKKIYAIAKGSNKPRLLYNFDLKQGNTVKCGVDGANFGCLLDAGEKLDTLFGFPLTYSLRVEKIDTIKSSNTGMIYRRFTLSLIDAYNLHVQGINNIVWVEGIGSGAGPFSTWQPLPLKGGFSQKCYVDKTNIFGQDLYYEEEYPSFVGSPQAAITKNSKVYDIGGRHLPKAPQRGVYIQNGKKVAVK